jgi:hypothetical protein
MRPVSIFDGVEVELGSREPYSITSSASASNTRMAMQTSVTNPISPMSAANVISGKTIPSGTIAAAIGWRAWPLSRRRFPPAVLCG